jgi:alpha-tubulin suppressor-like RCC1 family protein
VLGWGEFGRGDLGNGKVEFTSIPLQTAGSSGITAVSAGWDFALALKSDGTVWAWGNDPEGELGNGTSTASDSPVEVPGLSGVTAVAAGYDFSLALVSDGTVWAWGYNGDGELGHAPGTDGDSTNSDGLCYNAKPVQVTGLAGATAVSGGEIFALALRNDGTVWAWGYNYYGELGNGTTTSSSVPVQVTGLTGVTAVSAGSDFALALKNDGTVWAWGENGFYGVLGPGTSAGYSDVPVQVTGLSSVTAVAAGYDFSLALKNDGTVWAWGCGCGGTLGNGTNTVSSVPVQATALTGATAVSAGGILAMALKSDGTVWAWGYNVEGDLGHAPGTDGDFADGTVSYCNDEPVEVTGLTGAAAVSAGGYNFALALKSDGTVWAWGNNARGQLGSGALPQVTVPDQAVGVSGVTAVSAGGAFALALKRDGTVWAWGDNVDGELGSGASAGCSNVPVQVTGLFGVTDISAGYADAYAVRSDGTVWAWGLNDRDELGIGTNGGYSTVPVQVTGLSGVTAVSAGYNFALALKSDGTVWAWGDNDTYQFGNGTTTDSSVPVQVTGLTGVTAVSAGQSFALALKSDGTVWGWGWNYFGEVGNGTTITDCGVPAQATGLSGVTAVAAGYETSFAVCNDGTVWAWGYGVDGELGNGTATNSSVPVQVSGLAGVTAISSGTGCFNGGFALALKSDGTVWAWGDNYSGELGNGTTTNSSVPVQVPGLAGVTAVAAGDDFSLAVAPAISGISGVVTPYGAANEAQEVDVAFDDGTDLVFNWTARLNPDGSYQVPLPAGTYNVGINGSKWLRTTLTGVAVSGNITGLNATLLPGDINGDNVVNIEDFSLFAAAYGSDPTSANWNPNADLNCDGVVDINDFELLAQDYGLTGDPAP